MSRPLILFFILFASVASADEARDRTLHAIFAPGDAEPPKFEILTEDADRMIVVNPLIRVREGICYIGRVRRTSKEPAVKVFRNNHGSMIPVQYVSDPDDENMFSMYADFSYADTKVSVPGLGAILLEYDAEATVKQKFETTLSVDVKTGVMKNDPIRLTVDLKTGAVTSLKMIGIDHDLVQSDKELYWWSSTGGWSFGNPTTRLTVVAEGPLVASVLVESGGKKMQITIFNDSERIRFQESDARPQSPVQRFFHFNVPDYVVWNNKKWFEYAVFANDECGVNIVGLDAECWIWPYTATFNGGIALRFASQVLQSPVCLKPNEIVGPKPGLLTIGEDRFLSAVNIRPTKDRSGSVMVDIINPTDETITTKVKPMPPFNRAKLFDSKDGPLVDADRFDIEPSETVTLRLE